MPLQETSSSQWVLGVTLGLLGSIAINTGNNIQSLGLRALKDRETKQSVGFAQTVPIDENGNSTCTKQYVEHVEQRPCSSKVWIIGTIVFVSGSLLNFASYAFAAQSMLASLESIQFVTNLIFGKCMLKAHITNRMILGTVLAVVGTVLAVQFSSKTTLTLTSTEMKQLYKNPAYTCYLLFSVMAIIFLHVVYSHFKKRNRERRTLPHTDIVMPLSYSIVSALVGTQSVVQAKLLAELLSVQSSGKENIFKSSFVYVTIVFWLLTVIVWLTRLNNALSKFDPLLIIPLLQCSFVFFAIVSGGIFFKEFNTFSKNQWIGFWCGICIMFSGLTLLIPIKHQRLEVVEYDKEEFQNDESKEEKHLDFYDSASFPSTCTQGFMEVGSILPRDTSPINGSDKLHASPGSIESPFQRRRGSRQSLTQAVVAAFVESAQNVVSKSSVLLTPPNSTTAVTEAMISSTLHNMPSTGTDQDAVVKKLEFMN